MCDIYQNVRVTKIAPDVPAPVWELDGESVRVSGGAGNVAEQFRYLSADVTLATLGRFNGVKTTGRLRTLSRPGVVNEKTRFVSSGHVLARLDNFAAVPRADRSASVVSLLEEIRRDLESRKVIAGTTSDGKKVVAVCSDYAAGFWMPTLAVRAVSLFADFGVPVVVDPKPPRMVQGELMGVELDNWKGATVVKLNEGEARALSGVPDSLDLRHHVRECQTATGAVTAVTRGPLPPLVCGGTGFPGEPTPFGPRLGTDRPLWASGAGDCFIAHLAADVAEFGKATIAGVTKAHAAGAVYTTKRYNEPVHPREAQERHGFTGAKIYTSPAELASRISALPHGARIGYTNGVFDLLHPGHTSGLAWARAQVDFLCVFLNSDESTLALRGVSPVMWQDERAASLAALASVDAVCFFNESNPAAVFGKVGRCEVLFKGDEYHGHRLAGMEFAERVVYVPELIPLHSSTIRERAAKRYEESKLVNRGGSES